MSYIKPTGSSISTGNSSVYSDYTFSSAEGTVSINDSEKIDVFLILNLSSNTTLYNPISGVYGNAMSNNTIKVDIDTSSMNDYDSLLIVGYSESKDSKNTNVLLNEVLQELRYMNESLVSILDE